MISNHIDQLTQWYADAERITDTNLPRAGDTLIFPYNAGGYAIEAEGDDWTPGDVVPGESARILHRAPKPKPAWHDAPAVIADAGGDSCVWVRSVDDDGLWLDGGGDEIVTTGDLRNVTPLIEAKVTDEARDRVWEELVHHGLIDPDKRRPSDSWTADVVHATLGLETK